MNSRFSYRSDQIEIMDNLEAGGEVLNQTLKELEVINRLLGGNAVTLGGIQQLLKNEKGNIHEITIADIGCGGGDILMEIAAWGKKKAIPLKLIGIDANPHVIEFAKSRCSKYSNITFLAQNINSPEFLHNSFDIVTATLFTHHFPNQQLAELFQSLHRQARLGVVINDLHRHWFAYHSIKILTHLFSKSAMVRFDAPVSVLRAFSRSDLISILQSAGLKSYFLKWKWAFRWQLIIPSSLA